jgi:hypothetical protein
MVNNNNNCPVLSTLQQCCKKKEYSIIIAFEGLQTSKAALLVAVTHKEYAMSSMTSGS